MAAIALTAAQISPVNETEFVHRNAMCAADVTAGQPLVYDATRLGWVTPVTTIAATTHIAGIALQSRKAGQAVDMMIQGSLAGFTVDAMAFGAIVYAGANAAYEDVVGAGNVPVGRIVAQGNPVDRVVFINLLRAW